jgi:hypothetical protein
MGPEPNRLSIGGATVAGIQQPGGDDPTKATLNDNTASDVRLRATDSTITVARVTATRDFQIDANRSVTAGALGAGGEIGVLARGRKLADGPVGVTLNSATATKSITIWSPGAPVKLFGKITTLFKFPALTPVSTGDTTTGPAKRLLAYMLKK